MKNMKKPCAWPGKNMISSVLKCTIKWIWNFPDAGLIEVEDAETGKVEWVDTNDFIQRYFLPAIFF